MVEIKYSEKYAHYYTYLRGLSENNVFMKFDTGASKTILALRDLDISDQQREQITQYIKEHNVKSRTFISATGNEFEGYLCKFKDIKMGNARIKEFYCHLVIDERLNQSLLGDDFISCCSFSHSPKGNISITAIDFDLYRLSFESGTECLNISEIRRF